VVPAAVAHPDQEGEDERQDEVQHVDHGEEVVVEVQMCGVVEPLLQLDGRYTPKEPAVGVDHRHEVHLHAQLGRQAA
jgi:hypothetical protein